MKKEDKLSNFFLTFIITSLNYKELPDFIEFAHSVNAIPQIWVVRDYSSYDIDSIPSEKIQELNILNKLHPEHEEFIKIFQNPVFTKYKVISDFLFEFNKEISSFYDKKGR